MKLKLATVFFLIVCVLFVGNAQEDVEVYKTFIYTSEDLADDIQRVNDSQDDTRRFDVDLLNATLGAAKGLGAGYITSFIDMGVTAIGNLITRNARQKKEWEDMVNEENQWSTKISSVQDVKDFYRKPSTAGALDPLNMNFDGIGCMRVEDNDTVFFISCHVDRSKLNRIVNHSKFELVLDTLIISPLHSNLPNTKLPIKYSFDERTDFNLSMNIKLTSSWFTDAIELHNDAALGEFKINIPVKKDEVDSRGFIRYVRNEDETSKYPVIGESFIVPRSYMGYRDTNGRYKNIWGTGQYKLDIELKETCKITPEYRENWKNDRKKRKKMMPSENVFTTVWQTISSQDWDEITKSWVITTLKAPAGVLTKDVIKELGLETPTQATTATMQGQQQGTQGQGQPQEQGGAKPQGNTPKP